MNVDMGVWLYWQRIGKLHPLTTGATERSYMI